MAHRTNTEVEATQLRVADMIGTLMEFWSFKRPMGRLWALLYLSPQALSAGEIGDRLAMSAGAVSMTLGELVKWGVVRRSWKPGERKDYFEAEANIWKMVTRVFRERELQLIRDAADTFGAAQAQLAKAARAAPKAEAKQIEFMTRRLALLSTLARIGEQIVSTIVGSGRVDTKELRLFSAEAAQEAADD